EDKEQLSTLLPSVASVRRRLGDFGAAEAALTEAVPLAQKTKNPRLLADIAITRASLALAKGEHEAAAASAHEAGRLTKDLGERWFVLRARIVEAEISRAAKDLERAAVEAEGFGLVPLAGAARLALAKVRGSVKDADAAIGTATSLGQRDALFQA